MPRAKHSPLGVRKTSALKPPPRASQLQEGLQDWYHAQTAPSAQKVVYSVISKLAVAIECSNCDSLISKTEEHLRQGDREEPAFRVLCRLASAGHPYSFDHATAKQTCLQDLQKLLGPYFPCPFPVKGGRNTAAGILSKMTCVKVTLTDIAKWFPKPTSQKMHIHPQLVALLSNAGCTWPPNADCFGQCSSFKLLHCSGKQQLTVPLALLLQDQHTSCVSDSEEYDVHADKQISSSQTLASSSGDESSCSAAHLPGFSAEAASLTANLEPLATQDGLEVASPSVHDSINSADLTQDPHMAGDNYGVRHLAIDSSSLLAFGDLPPSTGTGLTFLEETYDISDCSDRDFSDWLLQHLGDTEAM